MTELYGFPDYFPIQAISFPVRTKKLPVYPVRELAFYQLILLWNSQRFETDRAFGKEIPGYFPVQRENAPSADWRP
jgi:hypothetical protein